MLMAPFVFSFYFYLSSFLKPLLVALVQVLLCNYHLQRQSFSRGEENVTVLIFVEVSEVGI